MKTTLDKLRENSQLLHSAAEEICILTKQNKDLKILLYRLVKQHGGKFDESELNDRLIEEIEQANIMFKKDNSVYLTTGGLRNLKTLIKQSEVCDELKTFDLVEQTDSCKTYQKVNVKLKSIAMEINIGIKTTNVIEKMAQL